VASYDEIGLSAKQLYLDTSFVYICLFNNEYVILKCVVNTCTLKMISLGRNLRAYHGNLNYTHFKKQFGQEISLDA
jgi:hypothetical protein